MNRSIFRCCLVAALLLATNSAALAEAKSAWFGADAPGARSLFYGAVPPKGEAPNPETIQLLLRCADQGKAIAVFVAETSEKLQPGKAVRVTFSAGKSNSSATGRTMANQLAGVPSLRVTLPLNARVFAGMGERETLRISAGGWESATPLTGLGQRMKHLLAGCRK